MPFVTGETASTVHVYKKTEEWNELDKMASCSWTYLSSI
jgi:hypothetical protein